MLLPKGVSMDEKQEQRWREKAIRLWLKGSGSSQILQAVSRSRAWLSKWKRRYRCDGWKGLHSQSRKPKRSSQAYPPQVRRLMVLAYRQVQNRRWGLRGVKAARRELRVKYRLRPAPSVSTLKRELRQAGVFKRRRPSKRTAFYLKPRPTPTYTIQAMDWTERFLEGGTKIYAFHTIDLETRACAQTIQADKTTASVMAHLKKVWKTRGIPQGLQMDNDAAFYGGRKAPRRLGPGCAIVFVRRHRTDLYPSGRSPTERGCGTVAWDMGSGGVATSSFRFGESGARLHAAV